MLPQIARVNAAFVRVFFEQLCRLKRSPYLDERLHNGMGHFSIKKFPIKAFKSILLSKKVFFCAKIGFLGG
jgi:hypothetical protein